MKQLISVVEVEGEGLESLLNQECVLFCVNYFYAGKLVGVNENFVKLENASIIYETGPFTDKNWKDAQKLGSDPHYVCTSAIESFRKGK